MRKILSEGGKFEPYRPLSAARKRALSAGQKKARAKKLKIELSIHTEGDKGIDEFARFLKVLHDNGFPEQVKRLVGMMAKAAKKQGAAVPAEIERFIIQ